jgi:hypothetical protein
VSQFLSKPQPVRIISDESGKPVALLWRRRREPVLVCNYWRLEGDWWRRRVVREYYRLLTRSGSVCTVFRDLEDGQWYLQQMLD